MGEPSVDALLEDYKLRSMFASEHLGRMQTQFQVMLTLETALATTLIVAKTGSLAMGAVWIALLELVLSIAWLSVGFVGQRRTNSLREGALQAGERWASCAGLEPCAPIWSGPSVVNVAVITPTLLTVGWGAFAIVLS